MRAPGRLIFITCMLGVCLCRAEERSLHAVIEKGLGYLASEGDRWMEEKSCNSCHHLPELLWSHREASSRGFTVDKARYVEWLSWSEGRAADKKPGVEEAALMILALPERAAPDLIKLLADEQQADGTWKPAGQFSGMQKRGAADATANATRLNLLALDTCPNAEGVAEAARAKAGTVLQKTSAPAAIESLVFRALYARQRHGGAEADAVIKDILSRQRGDGGWSSVLGENMSDALATGQVLYALQPAAGDRKVSDAINRAQAWLIQKQQADGSWPIDITHISKVDRSAAAKAKSFRDATSIYTYWACGWATIGLLQGVPVTRQP